jgi:sialic acid synthase SpsE
MKDLAFKSPGGGLEPYNFKYFLEKKLKTNLKKDELLSFKNVY